MRPARRKTHAAHYSQRASPPIAPRPTAHSQFSRHKSLSTLMVYRDVHENQQATIAAWVSEQVPEQGHEMTPQAAHVGGV